LQDAHALQVLVALGVSVVVLTLLARTLRVAPPMVLLIGGVALPSCRGWLESGWPRTWCC
jgi:monovalent cation/hydrogen antiporter